MGNVHSGKFVLLVLFLRNDIAARVVTQCAGDFEFVLEGVGDAKRMMNIAPCGWVCSKLSS